MSYPPPQYILPPASLPLIPVRPSLPSGGSDSKSARAITVVVPDDDNNNNNDNTSGASSPASLTREYNRDESTSTTGGGTYNHQGSVCSSDAENIMSRGNINNVNGNNVGTPGRSSNNNHHNNSNNSNNSNSVLGIACSPGRNGSYNSNSVLNAHQLLGGLKKSSSSSVNLSPPRGGLLMLSDIMSGDTSSAMAGVIPPNNTKAGVALSLSTDTDTDINAMAPSSLPREREQIQAQVLCPEGKVATTTITATLDFPQLVPEAEAEAEVPLPLVESTSARSQIITAKEVVVNTNTQATATAVVGNDAPTPGHDNAGNNTNNEGGDSCVIRIGRTGNPVGSMGRPLCLGEENPKDEENDGEGGLEEEEVSDLLVELLDDNISGSDTDTSRSNVTHFPLEISTDNGGVSALLPSGQILVDVHRTSMVAGGNVGVSDELRSKILNIESLNKSKREALENNEDDDGIGMDSDEISVNEEARTPECSSSPRDDDRQEPSPLKNELLAKEQQDQQLMQQQTLELPGSKEEGGGSHEEESPLSSLLQTRTTSSTISEDPTFNSYAPSEMSSMMSHLEIQALLKQGRQQQQDMLAFDSNNNNSAQQQPPQVVRGGRQECPTMMLYQNQSLYAQAQPSMSYLGHGNAPNMGEDGAPIKGPLLRTLTPPVVRQSAEARDFPQVIQSTPSSSSLMSQQQFLMRTDAMEDASLKSGNNSHVVPPPYAIGGMREVGVQPPAMPGRGEYYPNPHHLHHAQEYYPDPQNLHAQEVQREQYYPHLLVQNPSMSSTITSVQNTPNNYGGNYVNLGNNFNEPGGQNNHPQHHFQPRMIPSANGELHNMITQVGGHHQRMAIQPGRMVDLGDEESTFDEFQLRNAMPLRCASYAPSVSTSVVHDVSLEGKPVKVEVEVGLNHVGLKELGVKRILANSLKNINPKAEESPTNAASLDDQTAILSLGGETSLGEGASTRTASTGRKSVQSLLGTSTKSLADDLMDGEEDAKTSDDDVVNHVQPAKVQSKVEQAVAAAAASVDWSAIPQPMTSIQASHVLRSHAFSANGDDGYSADRSNYTLEANAIDDSSTSAASYYNAMELRQGLPMGEDDGTTVNSAYQHCGYGHPYNPNPLPQAAAYSSKPAIHPTFPSLMDSSVSSALTASTAPSAALSSMGIGMMIGKQQQQRAGEKEEREDSLPRISNHDRIIVRSEIAASPNAQGISQHGLIHQGVAQGAIHDPLTSTSPAMMPAAMSSVPNNHEHSVDNNPNADFTPFVMHVPPQAIIDPRLAVDYERHYIVDLERINEESSGNHDLSSHGGGNKKYGRAGSGVLSGSSSISSPSISSPRGSVGSRNDVGQKTADVATARDFAAGFKAGQMATMAEMSYGPQQQQQRKSAQRGQLQAHNAQFYDYRHQYYKEQYHYCDDRFSEPGAGIGNNNVNDDNDSTCSSVTLSQAFHHADGSESCSSSITDDFSESQASPSLASTMSSVTLSRALSVDRHDHSGQGFYVATRLGDFVEVPNEQEQADDADLNEDAYKTEESEEYIIPDVDCDDNDTDADASTLLSDLKSGDDVTNGDSTNTDDEIDLVSDITAPVADGKVSKQITSQNDIESDLISALVPECGVPIPAVMAKVGTKKVRSGKGGMLLPWHSTRSIQNYQGRRGGKKNNKGGSNSSVYSSGRSGIFSISSVHTFRG